MKEKLYSIKRKFMVSKRINPLESVNALYSIRKSDSRAQILRGQRDTGQVTEHLFRRSTDGRRVVCLALARAEPQRRHIDMALDGISRSRSAFEQYHALLLIQGLISSIDPTSAQQVHSAVAEQINNTITSKDSSRWFSANQILEGTSVLPSKEV